MKKAPTTTEQRVATYAQVVSRACTQLRKAGLNEEADALELFARQQCTAATAPARAEPLARAVPYETYERVATVLVAAEMRLLPPDARATAIAAADEITTGNPNPTATEQARRIFERMTAAQIREARSVEQYQQQVLRFRWQRRA